MHGQQIQAPGRLSARTLGAGGTERGWRMRRSSMAGLRYCEKLNEMMIMLEFALYEAAFG